MANKDQANDAVGDGLPEVSDQQVHLNESFIPSEVKCEGSIPDMTPEGLSISPKKDGEKLKPKILCGYLSKLGMKGPLKAWKYRFFSYDDKKCCLLYYRMASDVCPLGSIDLCAATFHFSVDAEEGVFEIKTPTKSFVLKAVNNHAKMYWLQQLQLKRRGLSKNEQKINFHNVFSPEFFNVKLASHDIGDENFLPQVKTPTELVGLTVASMPAPQESTSIQNISLKHPWKEIQNTVRNICCTKPSPPISRSVFHFDDLEPAADVKEAVARQVPKLSPSLNFNRKARKVNGSSACNHDNSLPETISFERISTPQQQALAEELKSQKVHISARLRG